MVPRLRWSFLMVELGPSSDHVEGCLILPEVFGPACSRGVLGLPVEMQSYHTVSGVDWCLHLKNEEGSLERKSVNKKYTWISHFLEGAQQS